VEAKPTANSAGLIYSAIPAIMAEIPSIYKDRKNEAQHYSFRGIDDVYNAVNPILAKHRVFMRADVLEVKREERPSKSGGIMAFVQVRVRYSFITTDGSFVSTDSLGEGMDSGDKATPKAMSIAQKYAILQMFAIPTADPKDPENDNPEPVKLKLAVAVGADKYVHGAKAGTSTIDDIPEGNDETAMPDQMADIATLVEALEGRGKAGKILAEIKKRRGIDLKNSKDLTIEEADKVRAFLTEWVSNIDNKQKQANI
jgi:hypothetical protein